MSSTRPIHRPALVCALACMTLALVAVSAPASTPQDLRSPDAQASALAQERYYSSYGEPAQDLRTPDAMDAGRPFGPVPAAAPVEAVEPVDGDGIAPLAFGVALFGALIAGIGATSVVYTLRGRRRTARTA